MSDIIQTAQDLRSALKSERKDWIRERGGEYIEMPLDCTVMYGDEDAREVIGALAEETWEYSAQIKVGAKWLFLGRGASMHNFAKNALWFEKKRKAQEYHLVNRGASPARIVRRRVSPPEVINE